MSEDRRPLNVFIGLATVGSAVVGGIGLLTAILVLFNGDVIAAGLSLIAAALAFGMLANAMLRQ
jgi:hypothetical protein